MKPPRKRRTRILLGQRHTTLLSRVMAKGIDLLVVVALLLIGKAIWAPVGIAVAAVYCALQDALGEGQSVGKRIMGLRVMDDRTGQACSFRASALRNLPFAVGVVFGGVPLLWVFFLLLIVPWLAFELYIVAMVESGIRLGDVLGNTLVVEYDEARPPVFQPG